MTQHPIANPELSAEEIETVSSYLERTRGELVAAVTGLAGDQWTFKPGSECWCIREVVEHHVLTERTIHGIIARLGDAPEPPPGWTPDEMDERIPAQIPSRLRKGMAPDSLLPTGRWTGEEALKEFLRTRDHTLGLVNASSLRGRVIPHPFFGLWDGYHWLLAAGAHGARHAGQIAEIKSHPDFPC
jgi:uncharacterized damage-inducible protein DinB